MGWDLKFVNCENKQDRSWLDQKICEYANTDTEDDNVANFSDKEQTSLVQSELLANGGSGHSADDLSKSLDLYIEIRDSFDEYHATAINYVNSMSTLRANTTLKPLHDSVRHDRKSAEMVKAYMDPSFASSRFADVAYWISLEYFIKTAMGVSSEDYSWAPSEEQLELIKNDALENMKHLLPATRENAARTYCLLNGDPAQLLPLMIKEGDYGVNKFAIAAYSKLGGDKEILTLTFESESEPYSNKERALRAYMMIGGDAQRPAELFKDDPKLMQVINYWKDKPPVSF